MRWDRPGYGFLWPATWPAQQTINPTGDPKLAPQRILALDAGGHTGGIYKLIPNAYGDQLISVSYDKTIRLWDLQTGEPIRVLRPPVDRGALGVIAAAALSPQGDLLAVGGYRALTPIYDHRIRLISLASGETVRLLKGHQYMVFDIAFSPDGKRLASGASTARHGSGTSKQAKRNTCSKGIPTVSTEWPGAADGKHLVNRDRWTARGESGTQPPATAKSNMPGHQGRSTRWIGVPTGARVVTGATTPLCGSSSPLASRVTAWPPGWQIDSIAASRPTLACALHHSAAMARKLRRRRVSMTDGREISRFTGHKNGVISCTFLRDGKTA